MNKAFLICAVISGFLVNEIKAQSLKIDSLRLLLPSATGDLRLDVLHALAVEFVAYDTHLAIPVVNDGVRSIGQASDSARIVRAYRDKGHLLSFHGKYDSVIVLFTSALEIARRNRIDEEVNRMLNSLGIAYTYSGRYGEALQYFYETLLIRQSIGMETCTVYNNIGFSYYKLRENKKALSFFKKSLHLHEDNGEWIDPGLVLINIGLCFGELNVYDSALHYIDLGLRRSIENEIGGQFALGLLNYRQGKPVLSKVHFDRSLVRALESCDARFICENQVYLARSFIELCQYDLAKNALDHAEAILFSNKYDELLLDTYRVFIDLFQANGSFRELADYYQKFIPLRESIYGREAIQKIIAFEVELAEHENTLKLDNQSKILKLQIDAIKFHDQIFLAICLSVLLFLIIVIQVVYLLKKKKKMYDSLKKRVFDRAQILESSLQLQHHIRNRTLLLLEDTCLCLDSPLASIRGVQRYFGKRTAYSDLLERNIVDLRKINMNLSQIADDVSKSSLSKCKVSFV